MNIFFFLLQFAILYSSACKIIRKTIQLRSIALVPETAFLTKFDIGVGQGNFTIKYKHVRSEKGSDIHRVSLRFGLLKDDNYRIFRQAQTCEQKQRFYQQSQPMSFLQSSWGSVVIKITNQTQQHIWYLYLYDCTSQKEKSQLVGQVSIDVIMYNNGSYFAQDENFLLGYLILFITWVVLIIKFFIPVAYSLKQVNASWQQLLIYSGFLLLGLSYFYRLLDLLLVYIYGQQIWILLMLYTLLKYIVQGVMVTIIVSIAWGWSLTHLKHQPYYIIIGTIIAIINFLAIILDSSIKQIEQAHHQYDRLMGIVLMVIRVVIFLIFVAGIMRCMAESVGKRRHFIWKFGYIGGLYLISWPLVVIFVQLFLPNYMHNQVVTVVEEAGHIIANAYMCHLFAFPDSDFKKVSLKFQQQALPIYKKNNYRK